MPAIISSFINNHGRRGRAGNRETEFDSVCGDVRITSPTDYAIKQPDSFVKEVEEEDEDLWGMPRSEYKDSRRRASLSIAWRAGEDSDPKSSTLVCNSISPPLPQLEQSQRRSRSQSGNPGERRPLPTTKRASSSTRAARPKIDVSNIGEINDADAHAFYAVTSTSRAASPILSSPMEEKARPVMMSSGSYTSLVQSAVVHRVERAISPTDQRKSFQLPLNNLNSVLERETRSPPISLLSPVCEGFDLEDTSIESRAAAEPTATLQPVSRPQNSTYPTDHVTSPSSFMSTPNSTFTSSLSPSFSPRSVQNSSFRTHHDIVGSERRPSGEAAVDHTTVTRPSPSESEMAYSPPSEVNAFPRPSSRAGPGLGATSIMRPSSRAGNRHRRSVSCGPTDGRYYSTAPGVGTTQITYNARQKSPEQIVTSPELSDDGTHRWSPRSDESTEYQGESPKRLRSQAALDSPDPSKRHAFSPPLGTSYRASPEPTYYSTDSDHTRTSASTSASNSAGSGTSKPASHGNIYTELEHDLRHVARELSHAALADKQQQQRSTASANNSKRNQLRNRARSATRGIGIGISIGGSDKDRKRSDSRHRAGSLASSASASAAVAASRGVPAYEPDMSRLNGSSVNAYGSNQELVPEYDDLWC